MGRPRASRNPSRARRARRVKPLLEELPLVVPVCVAYRLRAKLSWGGAKRRVRRIADFATPPKRNAHFCMKMYKKSNGQRTSGTFGIKNKGGRSKSRFRLFGRLGGVLGVLWASLGESETLQRVSSREFRRKMSSKRVRKSVWT